MAEKQEDPWMPAPQAPVGCPPGLEYLTQLDQVLVNQQLELTEILTGCVTRNDYRLRNSLGQQFYFAEEDSSCFARQCFKENRPFSMSIKDNNGVEVIHLERPLRCSAWCCFCCLQELEVQAPPGQIVGYVKQDCTFLYPIFTIENGSHEPVLKIKGPLCTCRCCADVEFQITSIDGTHRVGKISKQWSGLVKEFFTSADNFGIQFPMDLDVKLKAVMIGACMLIDFMFFERQQSGGHGGSGGGGH